MPLHIVTDIPLSGQPTRWDYASLDPITHHLFLSHLGDDTVTVFDTKRQTVIANIPDLSQVHGVLFISPLNRVYASATGTNEVVAIDTHTFELLARIPVGQHPDGMAYAPKQRRLFVSDERGGTESVIDVDTNTKVASISLGGEVGNSQYDPVSGHIFVNLQTAGQLAEIDPASDQVVAKTPLPGAQGNHGLFIDSASRLAFVACSDNNTLMVIDLTQKRVTASFSVARDPDVLAFDGVLGWLYVAGESGEVSLFKVADHTVTSLGTAWLGPDAHSLAVDPQSHRAYFPLKALHGKPQLRITQPVF
ncbi:MAG: YncE family protein [Ferrovum sp.]|nr:YncE family protein [Ferrovum sp.]NDU87431.1 YncE family protein [Ferrovum sp.]